jgi:hypothetical protein
MPPIGESFLLRCSEVLFQAGYKELSRVFLEWGDVVHRKNLDQE